MSQLTQISLRTKFNLIFEKEINTETWSLTELYWKQLNKFDSHKVLKCTIRIYPLFDLDLYKYTVRSDSRAINIPFDFDNYMFLNKKEKKRFQLEAIQKGMMQIAEKEGWETDPLLDAYNNCLEKNLEYQYFVGNPKASKDKKYKIGFWCNWDIDVFEVYWVLFNKAGEEIKRQKFIEKLPYEGEFMYFAKWTWLDNETVLIEDKYKYGKAEKWEIKPFN